MKKLALAALLSAAAATSASAGNMAKGGVVMEVEPVMAPVTVVEETRQSSTAAGVIIPLLFIAILAATH